VFDSRLHQSENGEYEYHRADDASNDGLLEGNFGNIVLVALLSAHTEHAPQHRVNDLKK